MSKCIFAFPSVTIAMKAQRVLKSGGISCDVVRTPKNLSAGCGYSTVAYGSMAEAAEILDQAGIHPKAASKLHGT